MILTPPSRFEYYLYQENSSHIIQVVAESRAESKGILEKLRISGKFEFAYIGRVKEEEDVRHFKKAKFRRYGV